MFRNLLGALLVVSLGLLPDVAAGSAALVEGDYNGDGVVNPADYAVWRDHLGPRRENSVAATGPTNDGAVSPRREKSNHRIEIEY